ncbi:MAG TPA: MFS transporter [Caulobacteraceae bacterium]|nr:MFS transporter [Caulobacteraceae bacterium]
MARTLSRGNDRREAPSDSGRLSFLRLMAFAFPALPHAFVALPLNIVIPAYYATHTAVTLLQIGVFTSASRLLDAFLDPMVGFLSDRTNSPWGKRKPWTLAAGAVCATALFFLFRPPPGATIVYYGLWSFLLYFGFSLFEIPRMAWSAEISRDYAERARINTAVAQFNVVGSLVFWLTPILLFKFSGTTSITGQSLTAIAWLYLLLMPAGLLVAAVVAPSGLPVASQTLRLRHIVASVRYNLPLRSYLLAYGLWAIGQGAALSSTILFLSDRMRLASAFPFLMIALFATTIVAMPLWSWLSLHAGRHRAWAVSLALSALARPLALLVAPGVGGLWPMVALTCLSGLLTAPWNFAPPAMLSDVIDYDCWKSRTNKAGNIFALNTLLVKAGIAIGAGVAFALLDRFHYHAGRPNSGQGETGLLIVYMLIPGVLHLLSAAVGWGFPLNARRQTIVRRRLESRARALRAI